MPIKFEFHGRNKVRPQINSEYIDRLWASVGRGACKAVRMIGAVELLLGLTAVVVAVTVWWYKSIPGNLPPGPVGLPLLGSMLDIRQTSNLPFKLVEWTKIYGPVFKMYVADKLVVVLGDYQSYHEAVINQADIYSAHHLPSIFPEEVGATLGEQWAGCSSLSTYQP